MKRLFALVLALLLLTGCAVPAAKTETTQQYTATFLTLFDTVTTIIGRAENEEAFKTVSQTIHDDLLFYHQLFDIYNDYDGVNNLKTINDNAGVAPVKVDKAIIDLLLDCKDFYELTVGRVNVAMGSVLQLWHESRNDGINDPANAKLPAMEDLQEAAKHTSFDAICIDEAASTVYITDPNARVDVGAVAKGWATQRAAENAPDGMLISVGGNVCATGPKNGDSPWVVGIQNPDGGDYLHTVYVETGCVVTSGDYQRTFPVDGKFYHHIIDPDTLYPSEYFRSVTVVCADSGLADALSTALFGLPLEEGMALAKQCGVEAMWMHTDGKLSYTPGFADIIRK